MKPMTTKNHLKRGYCCGCGCLYCVYDPKHVRNNTTVHEKYRNIKT